MQERGYGKVRISVIDDGNGTFGDFFDYNGQFAHKWTPYYLHSTIKDVADGGSTFTIGTETVTVKLPKEGAKTRAFIFADPCFSSRDTQCPWAEKFDTLNRLTQLSNTLVGSDDIDFWGIIGDNFYEAGYPSLSAQFFEGLSTKAKATPIVAVPGNHDYWQSGGPVGQESDQFGYGFMQMYGQDTEAALLNKSAGAAPYDYSVVPHPGEVSSLPKVENFIFSHQIGDVAVLGWTGASTWEVFQPYAQKYCTWLENAPTVNVALLLGHWNEDNLGCVKGMSTPDVYNEVKNLPGCKDKIMLYVDGHDHCNQVTEPAWGGSGFMIGGNGMGGCEQMGFLVLETDPVAKNARVDYFEVANANTDNFEAMHGCFSSNTPYEQCRDQHSWSWRKMPGQDDISVSV